MPVSCNAIRRIRQRVPMRDRQKRTSPDLLCPKMTKFADPLLSYKAGEIFGGKLVLFGRFGVAFDFFKLFQFGGAQVNLL